NADADTVRGMGRYAIAAYLNVPVYAAFHEWLGRGDQLGDMWRLWKEGDRRGATAAIPDEVVDELIVWGPPEACREHIQRYVDNGVTTPALALLPFGIDAGPAGRGLAPRRPFRPAARRASQRPASHLQALPLSVRGVFTLDGLADLAALAYFLVLGLAALDVVLPVLPSESVVILGDVLAWQDRLD